ncbi:ABC transporter permease [Nisaea acidiphila]|uniref:ABC transporter permease n=1 Tax=Nisaea acidiphila TaxID=1862145 RepID=A0A9J7ARY7_9PROT|nr:ABC transporter permease [Nisaea acidiphila]UUX49634.1 ABC transporter permease [Nisaea acidiphila]
MSEVYVSMNPVDEEPEAAVSARRTALRKLMRDKGAVVSFVILAIIITAALLAPVIAPHDPYDNNLRNMLKPPVWAPGALSEHLLGTDGLGRDIVSRLLYGTRTTLMMGILAVIAGGVIGSFMGLMAAYYKWLEGPVMRVVDILLSFPSILFGLAIAAVLGAGIFSITVALTISAVPTIARITRGAAVVQMQMEYITASRAVGMSDARIIWLHLLPNSASTIFVYLTLQLGQTILLGAALSFIGLGAQPPTAELGTMASEGRNFLFFAPHVSTIPSLAIFVIVLCFNVLGDALRDVLDPRLRQ